MPKTNKLMKFDIEGFQLKELMGLSEEVMPFEIFSG